MTGLGIAEAADRTGFTPATLRYYEQIDLLRPARSTSGYRRYSAEDLDALRFIRRAKRLGISLDEIHDLLDGWRDGDCRGTREHLASAVEARVDEVQGLIAELTAFCDQLRTIHDELWTRPNASRCRPGCGCELEVGAIEPSTGRALALVVLASGLAASKRCER